MKQSNLTLLSIENLTTYFKIGNDFYPAIRHIDLDVNHDEI